LPVRFFGALRSQKLWAIQVAADNWEQRREARRESSPGRQPWVKGNNIPEPQRGGTHWRCIDVFSLCRAYGARVLVVIFPTAPPPTAGPRWRAQDPVSQVGYRLSAPPALNMVVPDILIPPKQLWSF
jgi:hypothetical protein